MTAGSDRFTLTWRYKGLDGKDRYLSESGADGLKLFARFRELAKVDSVRWVKLKDNETLVSWVKEKEEIQ